MQTKTHEKYLNIYMLYLNGLSVDEIMTCVGCGKRTVYYAIEYGKEYLIETNGKERFLAILSAKKERAEKRRTQLKEKWHGRRTIITRSIGDFKEVARIFGIPLKEKKTITEPDLTFSKAIGYFGELFALESSLAKLRFVWRKKD